MQSEIFSAASDGHVYPLMVQFCVAMGCGLSVSAWRWQGDSNLGTAGIAMRMWEHPTHG